jgi:hypothetical protein
VWAPPESPWSAWAKPVLFAHLPRPLPPPGPAAPPDLTWVPPAAERRALVVDLPGAEAVRLGVALAGRGYRPVPVFNACPPPLDPGAGAGPRAVIDVDTILAALVEGAEELRQYVLAADAPPAFLVDANRQRPLQPVRPGLFDNCSVLFVTDFPSANFLAAHDVRRALLVRERHGGIERDLAYVLRTWQRGGVPLAVKRGMEPGLVEPLVIGGWWLLFDLWHRLTATLRLRRNPQGGYGGFVPEAASG